MVTTSDDCVQIDGCDTNDWDMAKVDVVMLGAGFSRAATEGIAPLMFDFFDRLDRVEWPSLYQFIEDGDNDVATANVERVLLRLDSVRDCPAGATEGWCDRWQREEPRIRRELADYCYGRLAELPLEPNWAVQLLAGVSEKTTVITTNYDNLAERVLCRRFDAQHQNAPTITCHHCKLCQLLLSGCGCLPTGEVAENFWRGSLIKLHGSITWSRCVNRDCCDLDCLIPDRRCNPVDAKTCRRCGAQCGSVMVMPSMAKRLDELPEIGRMWAAARSAIQEARKIVVFGFSFPTSDELIRQLFRRNVQLGGKLTRVGIIDRHPHEVRDRILEIFPKTLGVEVQCYTVPDEYAEPTWVKRRRPAP